MEKKRRHIVFFILFPIFFILISALLLFYLDLAEAPIYVLVLVCLALLGLLVSSLLLLNKRIGFRFIPYGAFLITLGLLIPLAKPGESSWKAYDYDAKTTEVLNLTDGPVRGLISNDEAVEVYAGVPYAKAPVGELRWKPTVQVEPWTEVRDATYYAPKSMQDVSSPIMDNLVDIYAQKSYRPDFSYRDRQNRSEDSLYLNIWRPAERSGPLPILVFFHGGSLMHGSTAFADYNGESMARKDVIMINAAYRLGVFGFFAHPELEKESGTTGNYGLLDQIEALRWVQRNATSFGGDPNKVTIAGESAGSLSVSALCASPMAKGLFRYAIGESSSYIMKKPAHSFRSLEKAFKMGEDIMKEQGATTIEEMRKIPAEQLANTKYENSSITIDGKVLTKMPYEYYLEGENNEERLLNGYNVKEADAFVIPSYLLSPTNKDNIGGRLTEVFGEDVAKEIMETYKDKIEEDAFSAFNEIISVYWFIHPHHQWSNIAREAGVSVYRYQFTKENGYYGTYHSGEMVYCYGNVRKAKKAFAYNQSDYDLSDTMLSYWSNFVKNGDPNAEGLPLWSNYKNASDKVMELGVNVGPIEDRYLSLYPSLDRFMNK